jgi:hypothetical protein
LLVSRAMGFLETDRLRILRSEWIGGDVPDLHQEIFEALYRQDCFEGKRWEKQSASVEGAKEQEIVTGVAREFDTVAQLIRRTFEKDRRQLSPLSEIKAAYKERRFLSHTLSLHLDTQERPNQYRKVQLRIWLNPPAPLRSSFRDELLPKILGLGALRPVLHTPSLVKEEVAGTYIEIWEPTLIPGKSFSDFTGCGEAAALTMLASFCAGIRDIDLRPPHPANYFDLRAMLESSNVLWLGSHFNPLQKAAELLNDHSFWRGKPSVCKITGFEDHLEVLYPGVDIANPIRTNQWPPPKNVDNVEPHFLLVQSLMSCHGSRLTIAAGTDTNSTLQAAQTFFGEDARPLERLQLIDKHKNENYEFELLFSTISKRPPELVWPQALSEDKALAQHA